MSTLRNPGWLRKYELQYTNIDDIPADTFDQINQKLDVLSGPDAPEVSIIIAAWNEEAKLLATLGSLADNKTQRSTEIIVVNNNSTDRTQEILDKLHVKSLFQPMQGCGPARQLGLENARGKFILTADADCIYPPKWIEKMAEGLGNPGVVCIYGRYSFIGNEKTTRPKLFFYEKIKDVMADIRHFKRPHMNCVGLSMGFPREYGLKVGYVMRNIRGEDGRMCFDLMKYGKVIQLKDRDLRVWTGTRTLDKDGSIFKALMMRVLKELRRASDYIKLHPHHDTKTSRN
ncbi:MAG TPA: glycosyltransferase family 2 protein [Puia sp.]|nr:glycosyltransferase family 2 protein [Puia sp.]